MAETLILSVGLDPVNLFARETVLRSAGYTVVSAMSVKEAFHLFQNGDFDLMILGKTLPAKDRERLTCLIRVSESVFQLPPFLPHRGKRASFRRRPYPRTQSSSWLESGAFWPNGMR